MILPGEAAPVTLSCLGRRDADIRDPSRWVFNRLAGDYLRRPGYPPALVERLLALAGGPGARVADLGAGTGHLALPLAQLGARVTAVEPAEVMLRALLAQDGRGAVATVHAPAESTGLAPGAFDLVLLADALQWVDPELAGREAARILAPGGCLALVEATFAATPFMAGLAALITRSNPRAQPRPAGRSRQVLALAADPPWKSESFLQEQLLSAPDLEAMLRSLTTVGPALGPAGLAALLSEAHALAGRTGGALFRRDLALTWARRGSRPRPA